MTHLVHLTRGVGLHPGKNLYSLLESSVAILHTGFPTQQLPQVFSRCSEMASKAIENGEGIAADALLQELQSDEEDESSQSSSAGSPGGPPQEPPPGPDAHSSDSTDPPKDGGNSVARIAGMVALGVTGGVVFVGAAPVVLGAMGFTGAGIAASSIAAKMMSAAAVANGGGVAAGSLVATLQSVGAAGLSASSKALLGLCGTSFGAWLGSKIKKPPSSPPPGPNPEAERGPHVGGDSPGPQDESPQNDKPPASQNCSEKDEK